MRSVIYYPNFEPANITWLKFSLLFYNKQRPIVPMRGDKELSDLYLRVMSETDLIELYRPKLQEGIDSSLDAIDIVEKIKSNPQHYDTRLGHLDIVAYWRDSNNHIYKIFGEKFSHEWEYYCIENGFATRISDGMLMSNSLAELYMTVLANTIADSKGIPAVTDQKDIYKLSYFVKKSAPVITKEILNAQSIIELKTPANLKDLSFDSIIKLRNSNSFISALNAFHFELENFYKNIEIGSNNSEFVSSFQSALADYNGELTKIAANLAKFSFGAWMLLSSPEYTNSEFFKEIVLANATLVIDSTVAITNKWKNTKTRRNTRRYLASLSKLSVVSRDKN